MVKSLISNPALSNQYFILKYAILGGHLDVVRFLLKAENVRIICFENFAEGLYAAIERDNVEALKILLADPRFNEFIDSPENFLACAVDRRSNRVLRELLSDPRFSSCRFFKSTIATAVSEDNCTALKMLLNFPHIDPNHADSSDGRRNVSSRVTLLADTTAILTSILTLVLFYCTSKRAKTYLSSLVFITPISLLNAHYGSLYRLTLTLPSSISSAK